MGRKRKKEGWMEITFWIIVTGVSSLLIGFGLINYFDDNGWNPLILVCVGVVLLAIAVAYKKIRTPTSVGIRRR